MGRNKDVAEGSEPGPGQQTRDQSPARDSEEEPGEEIDQNINQGADAVSPVETSVEMSPQRQLAKSSATSCVLEKEEGEPRKSPQPQVGVAQPAKQYLEGFQSDQRHSVTSLSQDCESETSRLLRELAELTQHIVVPEQFSANQKQDSPKHQSPTNISDLSRQAVGLVIVPSRSNSAVTTPVKTRSACQSSSQLPSTADEKSEVNGTKTEPINRSSVEAADDQKPGPPQEWKPEEDRKPGPSQEQSPEDQTPGPSQKQSPEEDQTPGPSQKRCPEEDQTPGPSQKRKPEEDQKPGPSQKRKPGEDQTPGPSQKRKPEEDQTPGPSQKRKPREDQKPGPSQKRRPEEDQKPGPAQKQKSEVKKPGPSKKRKPEETKKCLAAVWSELNRQSMYKIYKVLPNYESSSSSEDEAVKHMNSCTTYRRPKRRVYWMSDSEAKYEWEKRPTFPMRSSPVKRKCSEDEESSGSEEGEGKRKRASSPSPDRKRKCTDDESSENEDEAKRRRT